MDFYASHDMEDILSVIDGRLEIVEEVMVTNGDLKKYLAKSFSEMMQNRFFHDALPGHLVHYGNLSEERIDLLLEKVNQIVTHF